MGRDSQSKMSKNESIKTNKKENDRKKKHTESSDDDSSFYTDDDDVEEMDTHEYRKFLKKIFPSKYLDKKVKAGERLKKTFESEYETEEDDSDYETEDNSEEDDSEEDDSEEDDSEEEDSEEEVVKKKSHKLSKKRNKPVIKKSNKKKQDDSEEDDEEEQDKYILRRKSKKKIVVSEDESEEGSISEDKSKLGKFNIIFTIGNKKEDNNIEDEDDEDWETSSDSNTENEDEPVSSDSDEDNNPKKSSEMKRNETKKKEMDKKLVMSSKMDSDLEKEITKRDNLILNQLNEMLSKNPNDKSIQKCIEVYEDDIKKEKSKCEKKTKKEKDRNSRIFKKILRDKNAMNDFEFYEKLDLIQQKKLIKELREINKITRVEKPYRLTLLDCNMPIIFKAAAMKKISSLRYMEQGSGEYYKIKNWVDTFMRIPFGEYKTLPLSIDDGVEKCHDFMASAQQTLDGAVYGLTDAKMQIMQMLGQLITNPNAIGTAIAIHGPPGTGKTSLVKEGISKILNRPFAFIALGGATDSSFLEGHGYTYEGSTWGKIVQILIDSKCMNPVIYFDELDKISDTPKGEEIAGILTHLTDTSQNSQFHDKYFSDIDFDLSKCLFIFSYNDETKINPILKDRMYRIQTKGYSQKQKTVISNNYLLPKIREQVKFKVEDIIIPDATLNYIVENHCNKEDGVRNLKRCLEIIHTKLNLYRLMREDSNLFEEEMSLKVTFPFTVTKDIVDKLIKKTEGLNPSLYHLYI